MYTVFLMRRVLVPARGRVALLRGVLKDLGPPESDTATDTSGLLSSPGLASCGEVRRQLKCQRPMAKCMASRVDVSPVSLDAWRHACCPERRRRQQAYLDACKAAAEREDEAGPPACILRLTMPFHIFYEMVDSGVMLPCLHINGYRVYQDPVSYTHLTLPTKRIV